ncbi:MAG: Stk1 family PASTA domain-containing Ser/Thr kinase [Propionibacteriaceae bacterium]|nr:Stk1 family PASTA domain-containing Ser/Thr kinase [Propionibacteriaceae bacterium]
MTERGALLGNRYELEQIIGRGGMAEVWKARDNRLHRDVAVKRLRVDLASDATFQARFRREAQAAAGLNHPNIVSVYDTGEEIDPKSDIHVPYIVMEYVDGVTLREVLRDGRKILPERALEFTQGVLDALSYSHRAGIVHRDIKPANVMLTNAGAVKVMDFGIARAVADTSATMTQTAAVIGTAQYLSPEQARGEKVDARSDIYSAGCLLYELLVGRPPFIGDSPVSVAYQHVREIPVAPSTLDPEITPAMDAIVLKALAKDPNERYPDARAMREDISRCLDNVPVTAVVPRVMPAPVPAPEPATQVMVEPDTPTTVAARRAVNGAASGGKKKVSAATIVVSSLVGALIITIAIVGYILTRSETPKIEMVEVPGVVGFTYTAANDSLSKAGFKVELKRANNAAPKDQVIDQTPKGGESAPKNSSVTITVSDGPAEKSVPPLTGMTRDEVTKALRDSGFKVAPVFKEADPKTEPTTAKADTAISSDPAAGSPVDPETALVTVTMATGKSIVPNLSGKSPSEAAALAKEAGFTIQSEQIETSEFPAGLVFEQSIKDGTVALRSEIINVKIAKKPAPVTPATPEPPPSAAPPTVEPTPSPTRGSGG